jgi:hypothetical protein
MSEEVLEKRIDYALKQIRETENRAKEQAGKFGRKAKELRQRAKATSGVKKEQLLDRARAEGDRVLRGNGRAPRSVRAGRADA